MEELINLISFPFVQHQLNALSNLTFLLTIT